jgi:hypothetical protein
MNGQELELINRRKLEHLVSNDSRALAFVRRADRVHFVGDFVGIFSRGDPSMNFKYVVSGRTTEGDPILLTTLHKLMVLRGIGHQFALQDISGVQNLSSPDFVNGIPGLIGKLEHLEGYTLDVGLYQSEPEEILQLFQRFEEETLDEIHRRYILHADLKPENILYTGKGQPLRLIDWSIARSFAQDIEDFLANRLSGTQGYMHQDTERAIDKFALAMTLYKLASPGVQLDRYPEKVQIDRSAQSMAGLIESKMNQDLAYYFLRLLESKREYNFGQELKRAVSPSGLVGPTFAFEISP